MLLNFSGKKFSQNSLISIQNFNGFLIFYNVIVTRGFKLLNLRHGPEKNGTNSNVNISRSVY
jgi:hypothetical protein